MAAVFLRRWRWGHQICVLSLSGYSARPDGVDLGDVARGYGADFLQVDTLPALIDALVDTTGAPLTVGVGD